ncbi:MAG TPA: fibronectin type III domain-containing protein [Xanthomonadaceae bacterium]|nr:fibronectin type III domain-containing protein [Xanthomonadaceae bacterium]
MNVLNSGTGASIDASAVEAVSAPSVSLTPTSGAPARKAKVSVGFIGRSTDAILIVQIQRILVAMTGNAAYASPTPTVATLASANTAFIAAVNAAHDSKVAKATRQQQRTSLQALLRQLAQYVQTTSAGDLPTLLSSGYQAQRTLQPVGLLPIPQNVRLRRGQLSGTLDARCNRDPKAGAYHWRYAATTAPGAWSIASPTISAKTTLAGLTPGTQYIVQVRSIGSSGPSEWSDGATLMVA